MQMLCITVSIKRMVKMRAVRWHGHALQREKDNILKKALNFDVTGRRKKGVDQSLPEKNKLKF